MSGRTKALAMLKNLPRVTQKVLEPPPEWGPPEKKTPKPRVKRPQTGMAKFNTVRPWGVEWIRGKKPFFVKIPKEPYYEGEHLRRQYPPLTLMDLQRLIDLGRIDPSKPIDLTTICNTKRVDIIISERHYGVNLTDEGADIFAAKVNIEVQWASELTIAAVERAGGRIMTRFFDLDCVDAMRDPEVFFRRGKPIPRCKLPPLDAVDFYSNPSNRGYLADPAAIEAARYQLSQKYGYDLPADEDMDEVHKWRKDPRQIWHGLEPGWLVNLTDKTIIKPQSEQLKQYYTA